MYIVTGAAGFIGSAFVWELNQHGIKDIVVADDWDHGNKWKNLAKSSVRDFIPKDQLLTFLERQASAVTAIIHIGACSATTETDVDFLLENNFRYTQRLFQWCTQHQKPFMYASSCATYGAGELGFDDALNSDLLRPLNPYGYSKVIFDRWALAQTQTPPYWIGLRYSNVYGPNEYHKNDQSSVVFKAFEQVKTSGKLKLFKSYSLAYRDGEQKRDFVYIKEATAWMFQLLAQRNSDSGKSGSSKNFPVQSGVYNCGFGKARTWLDLAHAVFQAMNQPPQIEFIEMPESIRGHYQYFTEANMKRMLERGMTPPQWTLEKGIHDYITQYLLKPDPYL